MFGWQLPMVLMGVSMWHSRQPQAAVKQYRLCAGSAASATLAGAER